MTTAEDVVWFVGKTGVKLGANFLMPGSGAMIDFADAANGFYNGDIAGGVLSAASGIFDLVTLGLWSVANDTAKEVGKMAAINQVARQGLKDVSGGIGRDAGKAIAKKGSVEWMATTANAFYKLNSELGKGCVGEMVGEMTERALYDVTRTSMQTLATTAALGAVSSGGVDVTKTMAKGVAANLGKEMMKTAPKETFNSAIAFTVKRAATETFMETQRHALAVSGLKAGIVGGIKYGQSMESTPVVNHVGYPAPSPGVMNHAAAQSTYAAPNQTSQVVPAYGGSTQHGYYQPNPVATPAFWGNTQHGYYQPNPAASPAYGPGNTQHGLYQHNPMPITQYTRAY